MFHAIEFSFLTSGTLKMALVGQSDYLTFTHQSLINDKNTALFPDGSDVIEDLHFFLLPEKFYLA